MNVAKSSLRQGMEWKFPSYVHMSLEVRAGAFFMIRDGFPSKMNHQSGIYCTRFHLGAFFTNSLVGCSVSPTTETSNENMSLQSILSRASGTTDIKATTHPKISINGWSFVIPYCSPSSLRVASEGVQDSHCGRSENFLFKGPHYPLLRKMESIQDVHPENFSTFIPQIHLEMAHV